MIYNNQGSLAFYTPYVVSEVVLTKGWTEPAAPASKLSTRNSTVGKSVVNGGDFKAPAKPHSRTVFAPKQQTKTTVVTKKAPTKEEIRKGMEQLGKRLGYLPR